jgi:two-component system C4-dicarboxylate transport sensor histidine kinase DctB
VDRYREISLQRILYWPIELWSAHGPLARLGRFGGFVASLCLAAVIGHVWGRDSGIQSLRQEQSHKLDVYVNALRDVLLRYDYLPSVISLNRDVKDLMKEPDNRERLQTVQKYLEQASLNAGATAIYVMDVNGLTVAASNWRESNSFVGMNFSYRPYFKDGLKGLHGRFYGIGAANAEPGYYSAYGIYDGARILGVAAVKINLERIDESWLRGGDAVLVSDGNGVVFLTSVPQWRFNTLNSLDDETRKRLAATRQYEAIGTLRPIGFTEEKRLDAETMLVSAGRHILNLTGPNGLEEYLAQGRTVPGTDWRLTVLSSASSVERVALEASFAASFMVIFLTLLAKYIDQWRRVTETQRSAQAQLVKTNDELERKVAVRTFDLSSANGRLLVEIAERRRAEEALKNTMEELVQAGKMAALGQMSAGVTHELNQPLVALHTLSDNAIVFLERGQIDEVRGNLRLIAQLVTRMGKITAQLKRFAHKASLEMGPIELEGVIADALSLFEPRLRAEGVEVVTQVSQNTTARCDANRLEQVFVNLYSNACDAMAKCTNRVLSTIVTREENTIRIVVRDTGGGIPPHVMPRLFEPFNTTKQQGVGLGLGLTISAGIVREFGGTLKARNISGGSEFAIELRAYAEELADA